MKNRFFLIIFLCGIIINIAGYYSADFIKVYYKHYLFLDTTGTILAGVLLGPLAGAITGLLTNLILGAVANPVNIPFAVVNLLIGITAGLVSLRSGFLSIKSLLICTVSVTLVSAFSAAVVAYFVFGGVTGAKLDLNIISLVNAGYQIMLSSFLVRIPVNLVDKGISAAAVFIVVKFLQPEYRGFARGRE
jgi:energy-coupling factor transport system substrate-specific component